MNISSGRDREASTIRQANRAASVGRLMLGEIRHWDEFLGADQVELTTLPRRQLKSGKADVKRRLSTELEKFCQTNFIGMTQKRLSEMYEVIKAFRGMEMTLLEFESRFAPVRKEVLRGNPAHLTVSVSLWGLQFRIPEEELAKDIMEAVDFAAVAQEQLMQFESSPHAELRRNRSKIGLLLRQKVFAARSGVIACFNLMEAYLNGIAWDYFRTANTDGLSNRSKKLLDDSASASIREKLQKYPEIIAGTSPWNTADTDLSQFLDVVKPFRDSLVHPSPFAAPEKFGGYDKLRLLYRTDKQTADLAAYTTANLVLRIQKHIKPELALPPWMEELWAKVGIDENSQVRPPDRRKRAPASR